MYVFARVCSYEVFSSTVNGLCFFEDTLNLAGIYLLKVNNRNTRIKYETRSGVFIANFEYVSHFVLVFLLLTLNMFFDGWESLVC